MNIKKLLSRMTIEEKVAQLRCYRSLNLVVDGELSHKNTKKLLRNGLGFIASLAADKPPLEAVEIVNTVQRYQVEKTRLGIPAILTQEALHGVLSERTTMFPQAISLSSAFDPTLVSCVATAIGREMRALGHTLALSPVLDLARDPRCGRAEETYGEDPTLAADLGIAFVKAMRKQGVGCTLKHFAANFVADGGRDSHDLRLSEHAMHEMHLRPYEICIRKSDPAAIMPAYGTINGRPAACNSWLLVDVLRKKFDFQGITGSDWWAIDIIHRKQMMTRDMKECAFEAFTNGMDVEWPDSRSYEELVELVRKRRIPMRLLNRSVERVLTLKKKLGLFKNPYGNPKRVAALINSPAHRAIAREAAEKTIVLLKNEKKLLPLSRNIRRVAVIGPNAAQARIGGYSSTGAKVVTPLEGLRAKLGRDRVLYAAGCKDNVSMSTAGIKAAVRAAKKADVAVVVVGGNSGGSWIDGPFTEGEGRDRSCLRLMGQQERLIQEVTKANPRTVVVLINGSMVEMETWVNGVPAIVNAWYPGCEGGTALARILLGEVNPSGKLTMTFAKRTGQLPYTYDIKPNGRLNDYTDLRDNVIQFPFGHGLSYTNFRYRAMSVRNEGSRTAPCLKIACRVNNTGRRAGDEVVQLYIHQKYTRLSRPMKELKAYRRISLEAGKGKKIEFTLNRKDLSYMGWNLKPVFEPTEFEIMIGSSSEDIRLSKVVTF